MFKLSLGLFNGAFLLLLNLVPNAQSQRAKSDQDTKNAECIDGMGVDNTRENNRQGGTGGHDNGEDDGTELGNCVVDEKLELWLDRTLYISSFGHWNFMKF